jgi:hypothetical protein
MLGLYPRDFRARFGREMSETLRARLSVARQAGLFTLTCVTLTEARGLLVGVVREWIVKLASDPMSRARSFPDCSRMRPVGITRQEWGAGLDDV